MADRGLGRVNLHTKNVEIVDVGPRDGLQSQSKLLDTQTKIELIKRLVSAGVRRMEVVSFVNPKRVPQMADADAVFAGLPKRSDVTYIGLVLNERGFERAAAAGVKEVNVAFASTDSFNQRNQGTTTEEMLIATAQIVRRAHDSNVDCGITIGTAWGCPFEGEVSTGQLTGLVERVADMGPQEIALADTIGVGVPTDVSRVVEAVSKVAGDIPLRCHFHNTRNTGVANAYAAVEAGVRILDSSCGGIGGCPFAPAATGNVATEDILYMLERMGYETGVSLEAIIETGHWLEGPLGTSMPAMVSKAGGFPIARAG